MVCSATIPENKYISYHDYCQLSEEAKSENVCYTVFDVPPLICNYDYDVICDTVTAINSRDIVYIHHTHCPNCNGLLDADEHYPSVKCHFCGAKIWSIREVS